ncbi:MAG TPA: GIY-YIG nuclease family protein, partial [Candidatus Paceibacterota bacterium]|nr:GIY-YIG nuclease family protein [Candidatus Paceibacterota bacterium]
MELTRLKTLKLPDSPGVYFFLGKNRKILYIGKATSLKSRVASYFAADLVEKRSSLIANMVSEAVTVDHTVTDSVLEALILETNLIRTHKPFFNTKSKDDKSYNHLIITNEEWPRVLVVRERDISEKFLPEEIKSVFGPFTSGQLLRDALKIVRKLFCFYDTKYAIGSEKTKLAKGTINFNRQIGLYPDPDKKPEYQTTIRHLRLFFEGKKKTILKELETKMNSLAKAHLFEEANKIKKQIFALKHIEDIALIKRDTYRSINGGERIEAYDIAHHQGNEMVGVMVVVQNDEPQRGEYRKFKIKTQDRANDPGALKEVLKRRFQHPEWVFPDFIVVDGNIIQINAAQAVLTKLGLQIPIVAVVKDERHKAAKVIAPRGTLAKHKFAIL